jgi:hypothetical protein
MLKANIIRGGCPLSCELLCEIKTNMGTLYDLKFLVLWFEGKKRVINHRLKIDCWREWLWMFKQSTRHRSRSASLVRSQFAIPSCLCNKCTAQKGKPCQKHVKFNYVMIQQHVPWASDIADQLLWFIHLTKLGMELLWWNYYIYESVILH